MNKRTSQPPTTNGEEGPHGRKYTHPAFATVAVTETSGGSSILFGSDVDHQYKIRMSIQPAYVNRDLNRDWIHSSNHSIVEVEMSHAQFSALCGAVGKGSGVPCTLRWKPVHSEVERVPYIAPLETKLDTFGREVKESAERQIAALRAQIDRLGNSLESGKIGIKEAREIHRNLSVAAANLPSNLQHTVTQAQEMLEVAGNDARAQIEAFAESTARRLGVSSISELAKITAPMEAVSGDQIQIVLDPKAFDHG